METKTRIAAIIIQEGRLLMQTGRGCSELWTPGGKIDEGENDLECLKRELKEEIGVKLIEAVFFKKYLTENFYSDKYKIIDRVYIAKIEGEIKPDAEIDSIIWLTKEDLKNKKFPMIPHNEEVIADIIKEKIW